MASRRIGGATFQATVGFEKARFRGVARFGGTTFHGRAWFPWVDFQYGVQEFVEGHFTDDGVITVLHLDDPDFSRHREWPDGCTIRRDEVDRTRGTLVYGEAGKGA